MTMCVTENKCLHSRKVNCHWEVWREFIACYHDLIVYHNLSKDSLHKGSSRFSNMEGPQSLTNFSKNLLHICCKTGQQGCFTWACGSCPPYPVSRQVHYTPVALNQQF